MSLLMDALRKAEEEKRRAAKEKEGGAPDADGQAPVQDRLATTYPPETPREQAGSVTGEHDAEKLSLEPIEGEAAAPGETTDTGSRSAAFGETTQMRLTEAQRSVFDALGVPRRGEAAGVVENIPYDQESTVPSKRMLKKSLEEYFEPSRSIERAKVRSGGPTDEHEIGTDSGQITAQTVFSAKRRPGSSSVLNLVAALLLLGAGGLGAVGAYHWYTQSRAASVVPSPTVAQGVERIDTPPLDLPAIKPPAAEQPMVASEEPPESPASGTPVASTEPGPESPATETSAIAAVTPPTEAEAPVATPPPLPESATLPIEPAPSSAAVAEAAPPAQASPEAFPSVGPEAPVSPPAAPESPPQVALAAPSVTRPTAVVTRPPEEPLGAPTVPKETMVALSPSPLDASVMPGEIRITRARPQDVPLSQLQEAYQAYQRGDYNRAETLYRTVLARNPQSRDALLGVAALAWRSGDRAAAAGIYDRVLRLDPSDSAARSALLMLNRNPNPVADESTLKLMLAREPDSPQLRFSLGNIYARQSRWSEAHKAYFDALARDKNNPDYAFNLAVSLDHLGQSAPALDYYRKAVQLAATRPPRFASAQANSRIQALAAASGSPP